MTIDRQLIEQLLAEAATSARLRKNYDLRDTETDQSQRMLNALIPGTELPIHRHTDSSETVMLLCGCMDEVFFDDNRFEIARHHLDPKQGLFGLQIPKGMWHTIEVFEPTIILETKNGTYHPLSPEDILTPSTPTPPLEEGAGGRLTYNKV